jgi:hypothetical protein
MLIQSYWYSLVFRYGGLRPFILLGPMRIAYGHTAISVAIYFYFWLFTLPHNFVTIGALHMVALQSIMQSTLFVPLL